jgi:hypothetical protein
MKTIEVVISPTGETKLQTSGFTGGSCREASAFLEAALGAKQSDQPTSEAFAPANECTLQQPA